MVKATCSGTSASARRAGSAVQAPERYERRLSKGAPGSEASVSIGMTWQFSIWPVNDRRLHHRAAPHSTAWSTSGSRTRAASAPSPYHCVELGCDRSCRPTHQDL